jgi:hypothetical protein
VVAPVTDADAVADALTAVPWLADLDRLLTRGTWHRVAQIDDHGEVTLLVSSRVWPDFTGDVLTIRSETDAAALRLNPDGGQVWARTGTTREVVDALLDLPDPGRPGAPTLVLPNPADGLLWRLAGDQLARRKLG